MRVTARDWVSQDDPDMEAEIGGVSGIAWCCVLEGKMGEISGSQRVS